MTRSLLTLLLLLLPTLASSYKAATVQYASSGTAKDSTPSEIISANLLHYSTVAASAALSGAEIIVFPEWGLFGSDGPANSRSTITPFCEDFSSSSTLSALTSIAVANNILVVANVCEKVPKATSATSATPPTSYLLYNTEVAISPSRS